MLPITSTGQALEDSGVLCTGEMRNTLNTVGMMATAHSGSSTWLGTAWPNSFKQLIHLPTDNGVVCDNGTPYPWHPAQLSDQTVPVWAGVLRAVQHQPSLCSWLRSLCSQDLLSVPYWAGPGWWRAPSSLTLLLSHHARMEAYSPATQRKRKTGAHAAPKAGGMTSEGLLRFSKHWQGFLLKYTEKKMGVAS